jgi:hypothetical protein
MSKQPRPCLNGRPGRKLGRGRSSVHSGRPGLRPPEPASAFRAHTPRASRGGRPIDPEPARVAPLPPTPAGDRSAAKARSAIREVGARARRAQAAADQQQRRVTLAPSPRCPALLRQPGPMFWARTGAGIQALGPGPAREVSGPRSVSFVAPRELVVGVAPPAPAKISAAQHSRCCIGDARGWHGSMSCVGC